MATTRRTLWVPRKQRQGRTMLSDSRGRRPRLLSGSRGPYWEDIASSKRKGWKGRNEGKRGREGGRESREGEGGRGRAQAPLFLLSWTLFTFGSAGTRLAITLVLYTDIMIVTPSFFSRQKSRRRGNSVDSSGGWSKLQSLLVFTFPLSESGSTLF